MCTPTRNVFTTAGVSGTPMTKPLSEQTNVSVAGSDVQQSFLISEGTPLSLMGRDLLCKLHASIHCTPDGLFLTMPNNKALQAVQCLQSANDFRYCWTVTGFNLAETFTIANIQSIAKTSPACASLLSAMRPLLCFCCVAAILLQQQDQLVCEDFLIMAPEG